MNQNKLLTDPSNRVKVLELPVLIPQVRAIPNMFGSTPRAEEGRIWKDPDIKDLKENTVLWSQIVVGSTDAVFTGRGNESAAEMESNQEMENYICPIRMSV